VRVFLALLLVTAAAASSLHGDDQKAPPPRPNLVLIVADDLGVGELGCYGQQRIETPRLDAMAREGLRFTRFYAAAPVCAPARCSLMTGLHGGHAFVRDNLEFPDEGQLAIPAGTVTLPRLLQEAGYETFMAGKWGLGGPRTSGEPNKQGFDHWFGYYCQRQAQTFYPDHLWRNGKRVPLPGNRDDGLSGTQYAHDLFLEEVERFLRGPHAKPFFLYLPFTLPHVALQPEEEDLARYRGRFEETPYRGEYGYVPHDTPRAAYAAMITRLDKDVGRVLDLLEEIGAEEDTLVLFVSDNGPTHDAGGADTRFFGSTGGLRGRKGTLYEGGIRVPLIARWRGRVPEGKTSAWLGAHYDLMPTLLEVAGVPVPPGLDGLSFAAELRGERAREHEFLLWEFHGYGGQQAVRLGRWKGVRLDLLTRISSLELYDLEASERETKDVAAENPEVVARLLSILEREHRPSRDFPFPLLDLAVPRSGGF
jgi:arylsulfatase